MSRLMDRLPQIYLLIFSCFTFVSIYGKDKDFPPSCEVGVLVQRGTTLRTAPHESLTVKCRVQPCGQSLNVTWCKLLKENHCEQINETANVQIRQKYESGIHELISYLTFNNISIHDDGLYRCDVKGNAVVSHRIKISVLDVHPMVENNKNNEVRRMSFAGAKPSSWLPYFYICVGIGLLVTILIALTHIHFYGWKRTRTYKPTDRRETSTFMIPDLPRRSDPPTLVMKDHFSILNDIYLSSTGTQLSTPSPIASGNQPLPNKANESQVSDFGVYAEINHCQSTLPLGD
ncbi:hypothetical protein Q5P01_013650 [Channa striata]|uniref:Ig-like domain-containing protein n=1 Tax=Channa striata TaxID=64152 RepID=A0AA88SNK9_CHASR|nr:hypothetical protein Q5P01_013650 [Channa striata]